MKVKTQRWNFHLLSNVGHLICPNAVVLLVLLGTPIMTLADLLYNLSNGFNKEAVVDDQMFEA